MNKQKIISLIAGISCSVFSFSQDLNFAKNQVKTLSSRSFQGRGYVKNGDHIAAEYLANQFKKFHLAGFTKDYLQPYLFKVNTFPGAMDVQIDGKKLVPGFDFMASPESGSCHGTFDIVTIDSSLFTPGFRAQQLLQRDFKKKFVLLDTLSWGKSDYRNNIRDLVLQNMEKSAGVMLVGNKNLTFSVRLFRQDFGSLVIKRSSLPVPCSKITVNVKSELTEHTTNNIVGFIQGQVDTFVVFTAHYDHLGHMGKKTYYPGASDNASGTAMVLDFIRQFTAENTKPYYSYAFMLFSGEEAGLLGSHFYVENPLFPLSKIRIVLNLDMMGAGLDGVTVFNGSTYPKEYAKLDSINKADNLGVNLKSKGLSRGSDHYSFHEKKVKALFINTGDKTLGYHVPSDTFEALPFTVYENLFRLIYKYVKEMR
jgi:hypothetical protein